MAIFELPRDLNGNIIPLGRAVHEYVAPFMFESTLPAWLANTSTTGGTITAVTATASDGYLQLQSNGTGTASMQVLNNIEISAFGAIRWDVENLRFTSSGQVSNFYMGFSASGKGSYVDFTQTASIIKSSGSATTYDTKVRAIPVSSKRINLGVMIIPRRKMMYILEDDQVIAAVEVVDMVNTGAIRPDIAYRSASGVTTSAQIGQVRFTAWAQP